MKGRRVGDIIQFQFKICELANGLGRSVAIFSNLRDIKAFHLERELLRSSNILHNCSIGLDRVTSGIYLNMGSL
jgi:hypothetical protein